MKVSDLTGAQLDYWVARCEEQESIIIVDRCFLRDHRGKASTINFNPSQQWAQGGPIIERERIELHRSGGEWYANSYGHGGADGKTILIAAMRAYVASKFGDEVPDQVA